jgi:hypothetical protein
VDVYAARHIRARIPRPASTMLGPVRGGPGAAGRRASRLLSALHSVPEVRMRGRRGVDGLQTPTHAEDARFFTSFLSPPRAVRAGPGTREAVGQECKEMESPYS